MLRSLLIAAIWIATASVVSAEDPANPVPGKRGARAVPARPVFEKDVLPVLKAKCCRCHSEKVQKSELNLSTQAGVKRGSASGPILVAGKPDESLLLEVVRDGLMPPAKQGMPLDPAEVELLQRWIESGAHFEGPDPAAATAVTEREISQIMLLR